MSEEKSRYEKVKDYQRSVQYYETDKMGITHHSNYIRWMEEARIDFLKQIGWPMEKIEAAGIASPVVSVECRYKRPSTFPDIISIRVRVVEVTGVRLFLKYQMTNQDGSTVCEAKSEHCFLNEKGRPISVQRELPELVEIFNQFVEERN